MPPSLLADVKTPLLFPSDNLKVLMEAVTKSIFNCYGLLVNVLISSFLVGFHVRFLVFHIQIIKNNKK